MSMVGRVYRDAGRRARRKCPARPGGLVRVLVRWQDAPHSRGTVVCRDCGLIGTADHDLRCPACGGERQVRRGAPRNVLVERVDGPAAGERYVRPFRGLRSVTRAPYADTGADVAAAYPCLVDRVTDGTA